MGLLDDAIREHLDLKRARGGDPADIERMEREALGPVRREPTIGSARLDETQEYAPRPRDDRYDDELDEFEDVGYHDSTAPHPHHGHEHAHADHDRAGQPGAPGRERPNLFGLRADEPAQPRRRFLRRSRPAAPPDERRLDPGFHEEPALDPHDLHGPYQPLEHEPLEHEPLEHEPLEHEPLEHGAWLDQGDEYPPHEPPERGDPLEHVPSTQAMPGETPPQLRFDQPPKRPRFSPDPLSEQSESGDEGSGTGDPAQETAEHLPPAAPSAEPVEPGVQETTEFDVQRHIADTRNLPDEEPEPPEEAPADEDVLEETPEFLQDTPEHDRLWFEQRPPKDFDF
jgi:hypothetical protein